MWWIICIFLFLPGSVISRPNCGGVFIAATGIIQSPNFPNKFPVPIHCEWIIDAQHVGSLNSSIIVYMTQLFVFEGLNFKEYQVYDKTYQLNGRDVHTVTENNVTKVSYIESKQDYLVITLKLDSIESTHLRVLDHLLDVYGFNITYEITTGQPRSDRCTMMDCGFTGVCYDHFNRFSCDCFSGYEGSKCSLGPNSLCTRGTCKNGGTCVHMGDSAVRCECNPGFSGENCESHISSASKDCGDCFMTCPYDVQKDNICKCPEENNSTFNDSPVHFLVVIKFININSNRYNQLKKIVENQILKSVLDTSFTYEDINFKSIEPTLSNLEITYTITGNKKDERRLRSVMKKWSDRGSIGNFTLAPHDSISLTVHSSSFYQTISIQPSVPIHAGEDLILSCLAQGSFPTFRWFKNGLFVNVTSPTSNKWVKFIQDQEIKDQYSSQLGIRNVSPFDQGTFTCQIVQNGVQKCLSKKLSIRAPPRVWIEPMSLTVRKGENFTIKCFSVTNNNHKSKYTYSWTKNKELLPIKTETEHYEVLYPMGSILQVSTISKSTMFSCLVQDAAVWAEQNILVNVVDTKLIKTCQGERRIKLLWPETAPGTESLQECPPGYVGIARRSCILRDGVQPTWFLPDFSGCLNNKLSSLEIDFQKLTLGYDVISADNILLAYKSYLQNKSIILLPGEGSRILSSVNDVVSFLNNSFTENLKNVVLDVANEILLRQLSLINQTQVILLQQLVKRQCLVFQSTFHRTLSSIDVTLTSPDKTGFHVPITSLSYPSWYSYKLHLALPQHYIATPNKSTTLAVVVYSNLSVFLPQRSAIRLKDGIEMDYEVISNIAACWLKIDNLEHTEKIPETIFTMEFHHSSKNSSQDSWKILCGVADYASYGYSWNTQICQTRLLDDYTTRCICPKAGTYAVLLTMKPSLVSDESVPVHELIILLGCLVCAILSFITGSILSFYWFFHPSCLLFLKIQCCLSTTGSMLVFIYGLWDDVPGEFFLTVMSFLESFLLTAVSSQLSNLLIIYSELVLLPKMKNTKHTIVLIITGAPMIAVFGNHMAHLTMNTRIRSWWLLHNSLSYNIFVTSVSILILLYFILFYIVLKKLFAIIVKFEKASEQLRFRVMLLKRSIIVFCAICATIISSLVYINYKENVIYHYIFSLISVLTGIVILFCYIIISDTPIKQILINSLRKKNDEKQSPDATKQLKFFTKQKCEVENESTPYFCKNGAETHFMHESMARQNISEIGPTTFKTYASANFVENQGILAHTSKLQHDFQFYEGSPKQFHHDIINSPDLLGTKKFVELDLVASSLQKPIESARFYVTAPIKCKGLSNESRPPNITITQAENTDDLERQRPEGEEKNVMLETVEVVSVLSAKDALSLTASSTAQIENNLDAVMDSITHDLDYLLNGNEFESETSVQVSNASNLRRISKPPSMSVFEEIAEEPEEDLKVPEAITNLSRTEC